MSATSGGNYEGNNMPLTVQMKRRYSSGRGKYANLAVRPNVPDSFREGSTWHTGSMGSDGAGGGGTSRFGSGREGGPNGRPDGSAGHGSRPSSGYLRRKLTQGSTWVRSFFTYDEEAAPLDGQ
ncbi:hypothetical protein VaNZ11_012996, partial [Volvox africanus]